MNWPETPFAQVKLPDGYLSSDKIVQLPCKSIPNVCIALSMCTEFTLPPVGCRTIDTILLKDTKPTENNNIKSSVAHAQKAVHVAEQK